MTATALQLPGLEAAGVWQIRRKNDRTARALADRHYSRRTPGGWIGGPGVSLVLVTPDERAVWQTIWQDPRFALDGLDAWRCTLFRNEGAGLSSDLIRAAVELTEERWCSRPRPAAGWVTYVDTARVAGPNPGFCFKCAGWRLDRSFLPRVRARSLIRLRHELAG